MTREEKIKLLKQITAGELTIKDLPEPLPGYVFKKQNSGLFKCHKTGELLTLDEVRELNNARPIPHNWIKYKEVVNNEGQVTVVKLGPISRLEMLEKFTPDDFLKLMKASSR